MADNSRDALKAGMEALDGAIKHVARVRRGLILLEGVPEEKIDEAINEMCTKHHRYFEEMDKFHYLMEGLFTAFSDNPEKTLESLMEMEGGDK